MTAQSPPFRRGLMAGLFAAALGLAETAVTTQQVTVQLAPNAKIAVPASFSLLTSGQNFVPFTGTLPVNYRARSTPGGGGSITLQVASDFSPSGGPSASSGALTYTCSGATLGTACSGWQTATSSGQTPVVAIPPAACTGGGGACSSADPNSVQVHFVLENSPEYTTGIYSAQLTLTISSI
ncbi:MAG: hypothetical protein M1541_00350 [Acidobacteria bacterium]|nr:hypothetical protein [Acidobacteriota bacterium]